MEIEDYFRVYKTCRMNKKGKISLNIVYINIIYISMMQKYRSKLHLPVTYLPKGNENNFYISRKSYQPNWDQCRGKYPSNNFVKTISLFSNLNDVMEDNS